MRQKGLFKRAAALVLSSTMLVSVPLTANAVSIDQDGEYEILFNNSDGGTIDGLPDSKHVSFNFDSNDEEVDLADLVGNNVKHFWFELEGWNLNGETITTIKKSDFKGSHYLSLDPVFGYYKKDSDDWYIVMDFGDYGYAEGYEKDQYYHYDPYVEIPKNQFDEYIPPVPEVNNDNAEFVGWMESGWSNHDQDFYFDKKYYNVVTKEDLEEGWSDVMRLRALYKVKAGPNDTSNLITFDANGGTIDGKATATYIDAYYDDYCPQDLSCFVPVNNDPNLTFAGWNTSKDGNGIKVVNTGYPGEEKKPDGTPGICDLHEYYGDENGNITLYATWRKNYEVYPATNSKVEQEIAETLNDELKNLDDYRWSLYNEEETRDAIVKAVDSGKRVSVRFVFKEDKTERAQKLIKDYNEDNTYSQYPLSSEKAYNIGISVLADGQEIGRIKNFHSVLSTFELPVPDDLFDPNSRDKKEARLTLISENEDNEIIYKAYSGEVVNNTYYADLEGSMWSGEKIGDSDYEICTFFGKEMLDVKPYSNSTQDESAAENVIQRASAYRANKSNYSYLNDKVRAEFEAIVNAYESGKEITARFVMKKITPTEKQKANILNHLDNKNKDFTPIAYYRMQQYVYADGTFLTTFSDSYQGIDFKTVVSEIGSLPAETDPRHSRVFSFVGTSTDGEGNWKVDSISAYVYDNNSVSGAIYPEECSIYAFGYKIGGKYTVRFGENWSRINIDGVDCEDAPTFGFNFIEDGEKLSIKDFFGIGEASDPFNPYYTFLGWELEYYDYQKDEYIKNVVTDITEDMFENSWDDTLTLYPKYGNVNPKNTGSYCIKIVTRRGTMSELPTLGGKVSWSGPINDEEKWNYYIGTVKSSDFISMTLPAPTPEDGQIFLGWGCSYDIESGKITSHGSTITKNDFSESDVYVIKADYLWPADEYEEQRSMAHLYGNGGLIDGKEDAWYHAASGSWGDSYSMNLIVPVRSGYKFVGWNTKADGSGVEIDETGLWSGNIFSKYRGLCDENFNVTLYAQWEVSGPEVETITLSKTAATLQINGSLTLTATVTPDNAVDKTIKWTSSNEKVATVSAAGKVKAVANGKAVITATASNGVTAKCTITVNTLLNNSTVSADKVKVNEKVTITGAANGGTSPYTYAFYFRRSGNTTWKAIGTEFGTATKATLTPSAEAEYEVKVVVKDSKSKTAEKIMKVTAVKEDANALKNTSVINSDKVQVGDTVRMAASASGGTAPYTYAYYYKRSTNTTWKLLGDKFGTNSSKGFTPTAEADYDIKIIVKDSTGATAEKTFKVTAVAELELTNVSAINCSKLKLGGNVKLTGKAVGGKSPYTYSFAFKRATNTNFKTIGTAYSGATTAKIKPTAEGDYDFRIIVKDAEGTRVAKTFKVTVTK